jgi:hypothetical protein
VIRSFSTRLLEATKSLIAAIKQTPGIKSESQGRPHNLLSRAAEVFRTHEQRKFPRVQRAFTQPVQTLPLSNS